MQFVQFYYKSFSSSITKFSTSSSITKFSKSSSIMKDCKVHSVVSSDTSLCILPSTNVNTHWTTLSQTSMTHGSVSTHSMDHNDHLLTNSIGAFPNLQALRNHLEHYWAVVHLFILNKVNSKDISVYHILSIFLSTYITDNAHCIRL